MLKYAKNIQPRIFIFQHSNNNKKICSYLTGDTVSLASIQNWNSITIYLVLIRNKKRNIEYVGFNLYCFFQARIYHILWISTEIKNCDGWSYKPRALCMRKWKKNWNYVSIFGRSMSNPYPLRIFLNLILISCPFFLSLFIRYEPMNANSIISALKSHR